MPTPAASATAISSSIEDPRAGLGRAVTAGAAMGISGAPMVTDSSLPARSCPQRHTSTVRGTERPHFGHRQAVIAVTADPFRLLIGRSGPGLTPVPPAGRYRASMAPGGTLRG